MKTKTRRILPLLCVVICAIVICTAWINDVYENRQGYKDKLIRFHVIANSDSPEDQQLKLKVRDEIISSMNDKFARSSSIDDSRKIVMENIEEIKNIALNEIKENGKQYDVDVEIGKYNFPTKSYGNFTLPAGEYEAVRVVIGEGKGRNWWCVMFPPLCFIDITNGLTDEKTNDELKKVLTNKEYNMIVSAGSDDDMPIKLKFKVVELFEKGKLEFAKIFVSQK